ncbi:MAG: tRNA (N6-isopentenyl adenosine(37)-C2)-methylthiotransferase MiaB [Alphaproteobacteria bacterium]|nr:tRNA (N6-isopentenyl adenosine(37)-C2)-methylthiotransferase MiaB [Alphaproteobacteria bacterium]
MTYSFYIRAFGCQMNSYDTRRISAMLASAGAREVDTPDMADVIIFNTCYIREKAASKIYSELGRLHKSFARRRRVPVFAVLGCLAKAEGDAVFKRAPFVKIVLSSRQYHLLGGMIEEALRGERSLNIDVAGLQKFAKLPQLATADACEFIQIQEGCDQYCTYCCVPSTRGREECREFDDVMEEARHLASHGAVELNLLGQNVGTFPELPRLIREIAEINDVGRIRFTTTHPRTITTELLQLFAVEPKLMPLLYLPMQSGSDRILKLMNRKYTAAEYFDIVDRLTTIAPHVRISSDFIVGFPGEEDSDFEATLAAIRRVGFIQSFSFIYSPRPGTAAAKMNGQVPLDIKNARIAEIQKLLREQQDKFNRSFIGRDTNVLITNATEDRGFAGRNEYQQLCLMNGDFKIGEIVKMKVGHASYANLRAD